jgi:DNA-directed RNA polymerase specialized sigma24 family protein
MAAMATRIDAGYCEGLVQTALGGDRAAQSQLIEYLWPHWLDLLRASRSLGTYATSEDHVRAIATRLVGKLAPEGRGLELFASWKNEHQDRNFADWMRIVTTNAARDYVREQLGASPAIGQVPSPKRLLNEFTLAPVHEETGVRPPMTQEQTARELLEFAADRLAKDQATALAMWLEGATFEEIEAELSIVAGRGRRLLRSAVAVLRRHFNASNEGNDQDPA